MKKFFMKHWRKVIIGFGIIAILFSLYRVIVTPATIPQDFYKYGPENKNSVETVIKNVSSFQSGEASKISGSVSEENTQDSNNYLGISEHLAKPIFGIALLFCVIIILGNLIDGGSGASSSKKK